MKTAPRLVIVMVFILGAGGCVRRDGRNSDCRWPGETSNHPDSARHLSADAEFAEDLAIRYADAHLVCDARTRARRTEPNGIDAWRGCLSKSERNMAFR